MFHRILHGIIFRFRNIAWVRVCFLRRNWQRQCGARMGMDPPVSVGLKKCSSPAASPGFISCYCVLQAWGVRCCCWEGHGLLGNLPWTPLCVLSIESLSSDAHNIGQPSIDLGPFDAARHNLLNIHQYYIYLHL